VSSESSITTRRAVVREFLASDLDDAVELWSQSDGVGLNESDTRDALLRFLARNPGLSAVAIAGAELVGAILCGHDGRRGTIHHLAVAPAYRRNGVGSELLDYCLSRLRESPKVLGASRLAGRHHVEDLAKMSLKAC
jgi:putative acetyltransferase